MRSNDQGKAGTEQILDSGINVCIKISYRWDDKYIIQSLWNCIEIQYINRS
jgi:hypothetical protein